MGDYLMVGMYRVAHGMLDSSRPVPGVLGRIGSLLYRRRMPPSSRPEVTVGTCAGRTLSLSPAVRAPGGPQYPASSLIPVRAVSTI